MDWSAGRPACVNAAAFTERHIHSTLNLSARLRSFSIQASEIRSVENLIHRQIFFDSRVGRRIFDAVYDLRGQPISALIECLFHILFSLRPRQQIALAVVAAEILQQRKLGLGFDAFGDHFLFEALGERDDRLQDLGIFAAFADAVNERAVDLERVERQAVQIAERRIARAKIVDAELDAELLEPVEHIDRVLGVFHRGALGDLQL